MSRVLLLFVDGIGLGEPDRATNPFSNAAMPVLQGLAGGRPLTIDNAPFRSAHAYLLPLDATLGVPGLPQSGTGQTALFTGRNAAQIFGRHFGPWVPTALREMLRQQNVLTLAARRGGRVAFANAYPEEFFQRKGRDARDPLRAAPPMAALAAGVMNRHTPALMRGDAVASEIINEGWRIQLKRPELPVITAAQAGRNLARITSQHDLTLFAHYATDHIGHTGEMSPAVAALERVDEFVGGLLEAAPADLTVALVSDHGNLEDVRAEHTLNPALGMFFGEAAALLAEGTASLLDIAPRILKLTNPQ